MISTLPATSGLPLAPQARALLDLVATDPTTPLRAGVMAPGGYGKTALLHELAAAYTVAGVRVALAWQPADVTDPDAVLLVDDAHLLAEPRLRELALLADAPRVRMIVAYRPWPRPAALVELTDALRRQRPPVVLPPLTAEQIAAFLATALRAAPPLALVRFVVGQTRGVPRYVGRLVAALAADPRGQVEPRISPAAVTSFAADLDELDPAVLLAVLAMESGVGLQLDLLGGLLERDADAVAEVMEAARATGLVGPDGALVPLARHAIATLGPVAQRIRVRQRLATLQLARGGPVLPFIRPLLRPRAADPDAPAPVAGGGPTATGAPANAPTGAGALTATGTPAVAGVGPVSTAGPMASNTAAASPAPDGGAGMAAVFEAAGQEALTEDPVLAARLFAAATAAGRPAAARLAAAAALAGDLETAARLADRLVATGQTAERAEAAYVAAVALAHRGQLARSAELLGWAPPGPAAGFAAVGLLATGRPVETHPSAPPGDAGPPTLLTGAASLMARGVAESITGSPTTALSALVQAATLLEPAGAGVLLPDSPAALAALVALHSAELDIADVLLGRAVEARMGGPLLAARHRLLRAWLLMVRGHTTTAESLMAPLQPARLPARERLFAAALRAGLARRNSDLTALRESWPEVCQTLVGHPTDLFTLLPLGELTIAAARLGEQHRLTAHLAEADALLRELDEPPLWSVPLQWSRLHAAIIAERPADAERLAAALAAQQGHSPYAAAVAAAAQSWLAVLSGRIDPQPVEAAARGLAGLGLTWDGARLAGQAAIRTTDRAAMTALLDCARLLHGRPADRRATTAATGRGSGSQRDPELALSEREQQVAELVLAGLTYKQVGDRLYISAKTVEHHMARIRQRLGCTDRRELLARLRAMTAEQATPMIHPGGEGEVR